MPFFVFEGLDGSGLSTQTSILKKKLEYKGYKVYSTKEPTDGLIGSLIRSVLRKELIIDAKTLALLFAADRIYHLNTVSEMLNRGIIVISDRYRLSSYAFQSIDVEIEWLRKINEESITPDLTFIIDVPATVCIRRIEEQRFHTELYEEEELLEKIRRRYHELAKEEESTFMIDGNRPKEIVSDDIFALIKRSRTIEDLE
jgi:dTMP kinase